MVTKILTCEMSGECKEPVTMMDNGGFVYCTAHGLARRGWKPCRKLRPHELRKLERGETLAKY